MRGRRQHEGSSHDAGGVYDDARKNGDVGGKGFGIRSHRVDEDMDRFSQLTDDPFVSINIFQFNTNVIKSKQLM